MGGNAEVDEHEALEDTYNSEKTLMRTRIT